MIVISFITTPAILKHFVFVPPHGLLNPLLFAEVGGAVTFEMGKDEEDSEKKDEMDDDIMFTALGEENKTKPSVAPRWVTRVFAADCLCRIILLCENADKTHFDLAAARSAQAKNPKGATHHTLPTRIA